jgi:ABC-type antimicrobial peptide transport system permease subunit
VENLTARLLSDPLAAGTRDVLGIAAIAAAALGVFGLALMTRSTLSSERLLFAEYEALGVPPGTLVRSTQVRLLALSIVGVAAGFLGGLLAARLIGAFVAVTGTAGEPLPPIEPVLAWGAGLVVLGVVAAAGLATAALLARREFREVAARRLRA